jgi:hypothetical protein
MLPVILRPRGWNNPHPSGQRKLGPLHPADLLPPLAGQDQEPDNPPVVIICAFASIVITVSRAS